MPAAPGDGMTRSPLKGALQQPLVVTAWTTPQSVRSRRAALLAYTVPLENATTANEKESEIKNSLYKETQKEILISCSHSALLGAFREA